MEAELVRELPDGPGWQYEPKWDGFRGVLETVEGELRLWSRNGRPLLRYFPELAPAGDALPAGSALDGEIVIDRGGVLDFDALQQRLHPAESRVRQLAAQTPARLVCFDVLLWAGDEVWRLPLAERRARLEALGVPLALSPATLEREVAAGWLERLEVAGLDGVVAKRLDRPYRPGARDAVVKVKRHLTADCVVAGARFDGASGRIATLLLGLFDERGGLRYVGSAAVGARRHDEVVALVGPLLDGGPGRVSEPSRWGSSGLAEVRARPELVVEVRYDKWQGGRFRHGTRLLRFRPDTDSRACTIERVRPLPRPGDPTVASLLGGPTGGVA
ncbi:MAG: ATP-dependent DNA ligase [Thermoleophilia bacterium]|nr:ATP-dependent DNA ligase [Thermoleophilia bacterium]